MMDASLVIWWLVAGWCGTPWRGRPLPPLPLPRFLITVAVGLVGGVVGGWVFTAVWPTTEAAVGAVYAAVSGLPAFAGARVLTDILGVSALGPQPIPPD
jgi:uncharacterized membrane protein YeaQ/YmgE (transglycosylase-associated protein family)